MSMPQGYDYEFVDKLPDDCICKICLLVLRQPVQIRGCGHRFCKDCLYEATKSKEVCPVDLKRIKIQKGWWPLKPGEDVFDDIALERTIKSLHIKCPSKSEGCQWQGELGDVKIHEKTCDHLVIKCSKDHCDVMKPRMEMTNHLEHECEGREVLCPHCKKRQVFCKLKHHIKVCEEVKVSCPNACGKEMIRSEVKEHVSNDCPMTIIPCMYRSSGCTFKTKRKNMDHHLEEKSKEHRALVKEENRSVADGLSSKISMMHVIITIIISSLVFMHYQLSLLKEKDISIQDENQKLKETLLKMQEENQKLREEFIKMQGQVISHTKFIWRIKKMSEVLKTYYFHPLLSESFYTKKYGYRMRVFLYPVIDMNNRHLSIYVQVLPGEYDAVLPWPFKTNLTISLLDKTGYNLQMRKTLECHFSRLRSVPQGEGNGFKEFVSYKMLKDRNYIVEDSIYVQVEIEE